MGQVYDLITVLVATTLNAILLGKYDKFSKGGVKEHQFFFEVFREK
jgi:hypothetical protein